MQASVDERIATLDNAIIKGLTFESDLMNEAMAARKQQLINEGRLVTSVAQSQVQPMTTQLQETATQLEVQETINKPTSFVDKISNFATGLLPDLSSFFNFSDNDVQTDSLEQTSTEFDTIYVRGETVFVQEIAKLSNFQSTTTDSQNNESESSSQVVKKLDELIGLMQTGGIAVKMDGRKVSKALATAHDK